MTTNEFLMWLKGFFDISREVKPLTEDQFNIIKNQFNSLSDVSPFTHWFEGWLAGNSNNLELPVTQVDKLKRRVNRIFGE